MRALLNNKVTKQKAKASFHNPFSFAETLPYVGWGLDSQNAKRSWLVVLSPNLYKVYCILRNLIPTKSWLSFLWASHVDGKKSTTTTWKLLIGWKEGGFLILERAQSASGLGFSWSLLSAFIYLSNLINQLQMQFHIPVLWFSYSSTLIFIYVW